MKTKIKRPNNFIITGTPGVGKTTLIQALRTKGFKCFDEPARQVLAEQRAINGAGVPEKDKELFVSLMLARSISHYQQSQDTDAPVFFDRGIPDNLAYANLFEIESHNVRVAAQNYRYNDTVFLLPPWKAIYCNDEERKMTFQDAEMFSEMIENVYSELGYRIVPLPFSSIDSRVAFITEQLQGYHFP
jgi:predicted ATPase